MKKTYKTFQILLASLFFFVLVCFPYGSGSTSVEHTSVFKYTGDGHITFNIVNTGEVKELLYRDIQGFYNQEALREINALLKCHYNDEEFPISLKLIELIDHVQDHFEADKVSVISGYRSPEYNARLRKHSRRVASKSFHMKGRAMDIKLAEVPSLTLRNYVISLQSGGVGYYGRNRFVHVDTGPVRRW